MKYPTHVPEPTEIAVLRHRIADLEEILAKYEWKPIGNPPPDGIPVTVHSKEHGYSVAVFHNGMCSNDDGTYEKWCHIPKF